MKPVKFCVTQTCKNQRYRFSIVLHELRCAELPGYQASLMGLVNCLILANENLQDRVRIRNEFIGDPRLTCCCRFSRLCKVDIYV